MTEPMKTRKGEAMSEMTAKQLKQIVLEWIKLDMRKDAEKDIDALCDQLCKEQLSIAAEPFRKQGLIDDMNVILNAKSPEI